MLQICFQNNLLNGYTGNTPCLCNTVKQTGMYISEGLGVRLERNWSAATCGSNNFAKGTIGP